MIFHKTPCHTMACHLHKQSLLKYDQSYWIGYIRTRVHIISTIPLTSKRAYFDNPKSTRIEGHNADGDYQHLPRNPETSTSTRFDAIRDMNTLKDPNISQFQRLNAFRDKHVSRSSETTEFRRHDVVKHAYNPKDPRTTGIRRDYAVVEMITPRNSETTGSQNDEDANDINPTGDPTTSGLQRYDTDRDRSFSGKKVLFEDPLLIRKIVQVPIRFTTLDNSFDPIFLRDACPCPRCVDSSTRQKLFETAEIPLDIQIEDLKIIEKENVLINWRNDISRYENHKTTLPMAYLANQKRKSTRMELARNYVEPVLWGRQQMSSENLTISCRDYLESDVILHKALTHLELYGMFYLSDVPSNPKMVGVIANRIGPLRNTFYGPTWDVRSIPSAKNVAYTSKHLGFHMDLLYMQNPPGVQVLHCMKASTEGGESLFTDAFRATYLMQKHHAEICKVFGDFPVTYRYKNNGQYYQKSRPSFEHHYINRDDDNMIEAIRAVNWSPPFQAPFERDIGCDILKRSALGISRLRMYTLGAKIFKSLIEDEYAVFSTKMEEGTCVVFNNRRLLHARTAFSSTDGERWLRGAYVDADSFASRLRVLNETNLTNEGEEGSRDSVDKVD